MEKTNRYGLSTETLKKAKLYMVAQGYMDESTDIIDYTRPMVMSHPYLVKAKINAWAKEWDIIQDRLKEDSVNQSQNK